MLIFIAGYLVCMHASGGNYIAALNRIHSSVYEYDYGNNRLWFATPPGLLSHAVLGHSCIGSHGTPVSVR